MMFRSHNKLTTFIYSFLTVNSVAGCLAISLSIASFGSETSFLTWPLLLALILMLLINSYLAYRVYMRSTRALIWCIPVYGLQAIGLTTATWSFKLNLGIQFAMSWRLGNVTVLVNFLALGIMILAYKALCSVRNTAMSPSPSLEHVR